MKRRKTDEEKAKDQNLAITASREHLIKADALIGEFYEWEGDFSVSTLREFMKSTSELGLSLKRMGQDYVTDNLRVKNATFVKYVNPYEDTKA